MRILRRISEAGTSLGPAVKNLPTMHGMWVSSLIGGTKTMCFGVTKPVGCNEAPVQSKKRICLIQMGCAVRSLVRGAKILQATSS